MSIGGWTSGISMVLVMMIFMGSPGDVRPGSCTVSVELPDIEFLLPFIASLRKS